jgi:hypothetical protein
LPFGGLFWIGWGNTGVVSATRRINLLAFVIFAIVILFEILRLSNIFLLRELYNFDNREVVGEISINALLFAVVILGPFAIIRAAHAKFRGYDGNLLQLVNWFKHYFATLGPRPPIRARRPILGSTIIAIGVVGVAATVFIPQEIWEIVDWYDDSQGRLRSIFYLLPLGLFVSARTYFAPAIENLLTTDRRSPVLFLRSFFDERGWAENSMQPGVAILDYSLEAQHAEHFGHIGPFIAVGSPRWRDRNAPHVGAARAQLSNDEWQKNSQLDGYLQRNCLHASTNSLDGLGARAGHRAWPCKKDRSGLSRVFSVFSFSRMPQARR